MDNIRNIKLWLGNDQGLYSRLVAYARHATRPNYLDFIRLNEMEDGDTPDGHPWLSDEVTDSMVDLDWFVAEHADG